MPHQPTSPDAAVLTICLKAPQWIDRGGRDFRLFSAETAHGEFVYGVDLGGQAYHQGIDLDGCHEEADHPSEDAARTAAEASYARLVTRDILAVSDQCPPPKAELHESKVVSELRGILLKYADDREEARSWGGPTIEPRFPIDEGAARRIATRLGTLERELAEKTEIR